MLQVGERAVRGEEQVERDAATAKVRAKRPGPGVQVLQLARERQVL